MAQFTRTKKLTDYAYSPTDPASEDAIRLQVDNSIQEVADVLYSQDAGKGASQVGINGLAYATVQDLAQVVSDSGTGTAPPALSVGTPQIVDLAVTIGKLSASLQSILDKIDQASTSLTDGYMTSAYAGKLDKQTCVTLASNLVVANTTFVDITGFSVPVTTGKLYRIEMIGNYSTTAAGNGTKLGMYLATGAGTIAGHFTIGKSATADVVFFKLPMTTIGASGLAGSFVTSTSGPATGGEIAPIGINAVFKCTSDGELRVQFASEVAANATLYADAALISSEY